MTFDDWFQAGIDNEWISQPTCWTHGGRELTPAEAQATDAGVDVCIITARIWPMTGCC